MKVFFTASQRGKEKYDDNFKAIFDYISELGYQNLDERMFKSTVEGFYGKMKQEGQDAYQKLFNENIRFIKEADISIFECSYQSFSIGYMVQKSVELNKPTIALYEENTAHPPYFLLGANDEKLIIRPYNTHNLKKILAEAMRQAGTLSDKRFNFFITPALLTYLNQVSRDQGITKSTFIRNLILEYKRRHSK